METCPCKYCTTETGRSSDCHSNCKRYIDWKQEHDEYVEEIRFQRRSDYCQIPRKWYKTREGYWRNNLPRTRRKK